MELKKETNLTIMKLVIIRIEARVDEMFNILDHPILIDHFSKVNYQEYLKDSLLQNYPNYYSEVINHFMNNNDSYSNILDRFHEIDHQIIFPVIENDINRFCKDKNYKIPYVSDYNTFSNFSCFDDWYLQDEDYSVDLMWSFKEKMNYNPNTYKSIIVDYLEKAIQEIELELVESDVDIEETIQLLYLSEQRKRQKNK